ncbi:hypothetical protein M9Y10_018275 [Tritrichomonas musculus]|uniref:RRM domain-containing protein n=1 Tax=Tritrichomonas musculus TaxID=1915356 RepID=A0ABR2HNM8_9EUKA
MSNNNTADSTKIHVRKQKESKISEILPKFNEYTKGDLVFQEFVPQTELYYCFIAELDDPSAKKLKKKYKKMFSITNVSDIQRYHYYPRSKNIYTFLGFKTDAERQQEMKRGQLQSASIEKKIYCYPFLDIELEEESESDEENSSDIDDDQQTEDISALLPKFKEYTKSDIVFKKFVPKKNLFYCFSAEVFEPIKTMVTKKYTEIFGIKDASDIQRFCYYPGTKNIYTFIGFSDEASMKSVISQSTMKNSSINQKVYVYPYPIAKTGPQKLVTVKTHSKTGDDVRIKSSSIKADGKKQQQEQQTEDISALLPKFKEYTKSDIVFKKFVPKKNLFYCFSAEVFEPIKTMVTKKYTEIFGIKDASDIQRFCYYPGTKNIYTFIGFSDEASMKSVISQSTMKNSSIDQKVYVYPYPIATAKAH